MFVWYYSLHLIWEEMEAIKKFWGWKICLVYAYFFKHLSLSILISFMLIKNISVLLFTNILSTLRLTWQYLIILTITFLPIYGNYCLLYGVQIIRTCFEAFETKKITPTERNSKHLSSSATLSRASTVFPKNFYNDFFTNRSGNDPL